MPPIEEHRFQHGDLTVHYRAAGRGEPVVLVHGGGSAASNFDPVIAELAGRFRLYAYDLRGFGRTGAAAGEAITHQLWAEDLIAFLDHLEAPDAFVCGWSLGSTVAMNAAGQWPGRVRALCLLGAPSPHRPVNHALYGARLDRLHAAPSLDAFVAEDMAKVPAMFASSTLAARPQVLDVVRAEYLANAPFIAQVVAAYLSRPSLIEVVAAAACPVTIGVGDQDRVCDVAGAEALQALLAQAELKVIADCGHYYALEQPAAVAEVIAGAFRTP